LCYQDPEYMRGTPKPSHGAPWAGGAGGEVHLEPRTGPSDRRGGRVWKWRLTDPARAEAGRAKGPWRAR